MAANRETDVYDFNQFGRSVCSFYGHHLVVVVVVVVFVQRLGWDGCESIVDPCCCWANRQAKSLLVVSNVIFACSALCKGHAHRRERERESCVCDCQHGDKSLSLFFSLFSDCCCCCCRPFPHRLFSSLIVAQPSTASINLKM